MLFYGQSIHWIRVVYIRNPALQMAKFSRFKVGGESRDNALGKTFACLKIALNRKSEGYLKVLVFATAKSADG